MQSPNNNQSQQYKTRINHFIRAPQVRVILSNGDNGGVMDTHVALKMAREEGYDLIEVNPKVVPPICKIADHGKLKYEEKKQQQRSKKNQTAQETKEVVIRPVTDDHDLSHKLTQVKVFLSEGHRCKIVCKFRGREVVHSELGKAKIDWFLQQLQGLIVENPPVSLEGKFMSTTVSPAKKQ